MGFVEGDAVALEEGAEFRLEGAGLVVGFLVLDVGGDGGELGGADGEEGIAVLPGEVLGVAGGFFPGSGGGALYFLDPVGWGEGAGEVEEDVDVVRHAADDDGRGVEAVGDACDEGEGART